MQSTIQRNIEFVGNIHTEVLHAAGTNINGLTTVVVIPGNPGIADYYRGFVGSLHKSLEFKNDILVCGFAGHTVSGNLNKSRVFTLEQQISHKIAFLDQLLQRKPHTRFVLLAHSIGSFICLQVLLSMSEIGSHEVRC